MGHKVYLTSRTDSLNDVLGISFHLNYAHYRKQGNDAEPSQGMG